MKKILLFALLYSTIIQAQFTPITNGLFSTDLSGWSITGAFPGNDGYWGTSYNNSIGSGSGHLKIDNLTVFSSGQIFKLKSPAFYVDASKSYFLRYDYYHYQFDIMMGGLQPLGDFSTVKIKRVSDDSEVISSNSNTFGTLNLTNGFDASSRGIFTFITSGDYYIEFTGQNSNNANYHLDNVGFEPAFVTKVQNSQCGTTLPLLNSIIVANSVSTAQGYRFKVTNLTTNQVQSIDKSFNTFRITDLPNFAFNTSYKIEVALKINTIWLTYYGTACTVTTPIVTTQVQTSQCGSTINSFSQPIYADVVPFATGYQFKITNLTNPAPSQTVYKNLRVFTLNDFLSPTVSYNSTYSVEVAVKNTNGTYLPFGTLCTIITPTFPTTQLQTSQCNYTVSSKSEIIYADAVSSATTYRFRLSNTTLNYSQSVDRFLRTFSLSNFTGLQTNQSYNVEVSVKIGGVFGPFGSICSLFTPAVLKMENSDLLLSTEKSLVTAYPNPFLNNFKIKIDSIDTSDIYIIIYDMMGTIIENKTIKYSEIELIEFGDNFKSGIYNVVINQITNSRMFKIIKK